MKKAIKIFASVILFISTYLSLSISPIFFQKKPIKFNSDNVVITSHRGASNLAPENTLSSINLALKSKPNKIEVDVHQTLDSIVILMHDTTLDRTTNGSGLIKEQTFGNISKLDAGSWFSKDFLGEKVPTLEDVIKLTKGKCQLIIEIKKGNDFYPNIINNILKTIKKLDAEKWVIIHSFDYKILENVHKLNSKIPVQKLVFLKFKFIPFIISNKIEKLEIKKYPYIKEYSLNYIFSNRSIINYLKINGKKINIWTVNDSITAKKIMALGADGIITDNPDILKKISK